MQQVGPCGADFGYVALLNAFLNGVTVLFVAWLAHRRAMADRVTKDMDRRLVEHMRFEDESRLARKQWSKSDDAGEP